MDDGLTVCQEIRESREGALPYWRPLYEARTAEIEFNDGERFEDDHGAYNRDRRRVQFRGQQTTNVGRNKAAQATAARRSIEALPVDRMTDPDDAEIAVSILEWELSHPQKGFDDTLEEVIQDAVDARAGCMMLDFDPELGEFGGETFWRWKDPNLIMFEPGFADPHHLRCGWLDELQRVPLERVKAMGKLKGKARWHGTETIVGDADAAGGPVPDLPSTIASRIGVPGNALDKKHVWVIYRWMKNDTETYKRMKDAQQIPPDQRYIGCDNPECNFRTMTQQQLREVGELGEDEDLEEYGDECPLCGSTTSRRDVRGREETALINARGNRLVVMPALQNTPDGEPFYDGEWPCPYARSFPIIWITAYVRGGRPMGDSDTTRGWDAQCAADQMMTMVFDRVMRNQNYYTMPRTGVFDTKGQRFEFRDDQYNVILLDNSINGPPPKVEVVEGASLDPAWPNAWKAINEVLLGQQGTNDFGLTPDSSKDIAASTVAQLNRMGNIPLEHFVRRKNRAISKGMGVHWDYLRHTYTPDRLKRLKIGQDYIVTKLRGDDLANFDFIFSETPPFSGLEKARTEAFDQLMRISIEMPWALEAYAAVHNLPPSIVRKVVGMVRMMQQQPPPQPGQPGPELPPDLTGSAGGPPGVAGPNGASNPQPAMVG
jgi:hypothetical protein